MHPSRHLPYLRALAVTAIMLGAIGTLAGAALTLGHAYLVSQFASITEQIEEFSVRLVNALTDRADVRLGHR